MKKSTKIVASSTGMLAIAAFSGLIMGATTSASASTTNTVSAHTAVVAGAKAISLEEGAKHSCKGQNACKGQGGCKTSDNGCKGKNSCKGNGGCKGTDTTQPAPGFMN